MTPDPFSPVALADSSGNIVERYAYDAFGEVRFLDPDFAARDASEYAWDFLFHAEFQDHETKLYNYGFRYYGTALGMWLSRDPVGENGSLNLFTYVRNLPNSSVDFLGLELLDSSVAKAPMASLSQSNGKVIINVSDCTVVMVFGHTEQGNPVGWNFASPCSKGGIYGCWPISNQPPQDHNLYNDIQFPFVGQDLDRGDLGIVGFENTGTFQLTPMGNTTTLPGNYISSAYKSLFSKLIPAMNEICEECDCQTVFINNLTIGNLKYPKINLSFNCQGWIDASESQREVAIKRRRDEWWRQLKSMNGMK